MKGTVKIVTIGGGSSYTPELMEGFIKRYEELPIKEIWLVDIEDGKEKAAFEAAYAAAQKVLENPTDQAAVDKAEKDLEDARKALLATSPKPEEDKEAPTKPSDLKETDKTNTTVKIEWKASKDNVAVRS